MHEINTLNSSLLHVLQTLRTVSKKNSIRVKTHSRGARPTPTKYNAMAFVCTMDPLAAHEPCFEFAAADRDLAAADDFDWLALEPLLDNWAGWLVPSTSDHNDAAESTSRPTSPSLPPPQPAPILPPVTPIAEDYVDLSELTPPAAPAAAKPSCHAASKGEKRLRPRELTIVLRTWLERCPQAPYARLEEKKMIAEAMSIPVSQVTNFCNNFRKRFAKVGEKRTSYRELFAATQ